MLTYPGEETPASGDAAGDAAAAAPQPALVMRTYADVR